MGGNWKMSMILEGIEANKVSGDYACAGADRIRDDVPAITLSRLRGAPTMGIQAVGAPRRRDQCSPDGVKRNPGLRRPISPDSAALHPGYGTLPPLPGPLPEGEGMY